MGRGRIWRLSFVDDDALFAEASCETGTTPKAK